MSERVRLWLSVVFWCGWAGLGVAALHWWDHETWRQVSLFPLVVLVAAFLSERRRRRRQKRLELPPPL